MSVSNLTNTLINPFSYTQVREPESLMGKNNFDEMTRRLTPSEAAVLDFNLRQVSPEELSSFINSLNQRDWITLSAPSNYPYCALKAVRNGLISPHQFATVMLYWVNSRSPGKGLKQVLLFNTDGTVNVEARESIKKTVQGTAQPNPVFSFSPTRGNQPKYEYLTDEQLDQFFENMRLLPLSEQNFFTLESKYPAGGVASVISGPSTGFNVFYRFNENIMIPSAGMMQCFLNTKYGQDAVQINPVLGLSTVEDLQQNGLTKRDMALHFPRIDLPNTADRHSAPLYQFTFHDFYHAMVASSIPKSHRELLLKISVIAADTFNKTHESFTKIFSEQLIDMERGVYRYENEIQQNFNSREESLSVLFWVALSDTFTVAKFLSATESDFEQLIPSDNEVKFLQTLIEKIPLDAEMQEGLKKSVSLFDTKFKEIKLLFSKAPTSPEESALLESIGNIPLPTIEKFINDHQIKIITSVLGSFSSLP
ncbi:MAG: hypothetical protein ACRDFB_10225 [Rhabdochlamydiaceae bacterium]